MSDQDKAKSAPSFPKTSLRDMSGDSPRPSRLWTLSGACPWTWPFGTLSRACPRTWPFGTLSRACPRPWPGLAERPDGSARAPPQPGVSPRPARVGSESDRLHAEIDSEDVRLRRPPLTSRREAREGRHCGAVPRALGRPRISDRSRAAYPELRRVVVCPRVGDRRVLPPGCRADLRRAADVRRVRHARGAGGRARDREGDRRRQRDLRAHRGAASPAREPSRSAIACGRRRR